MICEAVVPRYRSQTDKQIADKATGNLYDLCHFMQNNDLLRESVLPLQRNRQRVNILPTVLKKISDVKRSILNILNSVIIQLLSVYAV